jgi:hypothetical protein
VPCNEIFEIGVTQCSSHRKNAVDAIVEDQPSGFRDAAAFVLIGTFVVVGESKRFAVPAQHDASISHICRIQDPLSCRLLLDLLNRLLRRRGFPLAFTGHFIFDVFQSLRS